MTSIRKVDRMGFAPDDQSALTDADLTHEMDLALATNVQWYRIVVYWSNIQGTAPTGTDRTSPTDPNNHFSWGAFDRLASNATSRGFKILLTCHGVPAWANGNVGDWIVPPTNMTDWANFVSALVKHCNTQLWNVKAIEVWSQPNLGGSWHSSANVQGPSPQKYADMLVRSHAAINAVDATITTVAGGVGPIAATGLPANYEMVDWWSALYANGVAHNFDAVGVHLYLWPHEPTEGYATNMFVRLPLLMSVVGVNGDWGAPLWCTEAGIPSYADSGTPANSMTETQQADHVTKYHQAWDALGVNLTGPILYRMIRDAQTGTGNAYQNMGLYHSDFTAKLALATYQKYAQRGPTMIARNYSNAAPTAHLASDITPTTATIQVDTTTNFPLPNFTVVVDRADMTKREIMLCDQIVDSTHLHVQRGFDGTTPLAHQGGATVDHSTAAIDFAEANYHITDGLHDHHTQYVRKDTLLTKGDMFIGLGNGQVGRLALGPTGSVLVVDPSAPAGATFKNMISTGSVIAYAGASVPSGWLLCDGAAVSRSTYAALFSAIATTYGAGNGSSTFNVPDLRGRVPLGAGQGAGLTSRNLGDKAGEETHQQTIAEMPTHAHVQDAHNHLQEPHTHTPTTLGQFITNVYPNTSGWTITQSTGFVNMNGGTQTSAEIALNDPVAATNQNAGGGQAGNVMQPYLVLNYLIKT